MKGRDRLIRDLLRLTERERGIVDEMRTAGGLATDEALVLTALFNLADHLRVTGLHHSDFGLRKTT